MRLRLVPEVTNYDFFRFWKLTFGASVVAMIASILQEGWQDQAYLDAHPEYRQGDRLISAVEKKLPGQAPIPEAQGSTAFAEALQQQVLREYARDEVEVVSGWVLSITESRLYALAALVQQFD